MNLFLTTSLCCFAAPVPTPAKLEGFRTKTYSVYQWELEAIALLGDRAKIKKNIAEALRALAYLKTIRSKRAVPVLCKLLLFEPLQGLSDSPQPAEERCPVYAVLVEIGYPAVPGLLHEIATSETSEEYRALCMVLLGGVVGPTRVVDEIRKAKRRHKGETAQARLARLEMEYDRAVKENAPKNP
jgi:hypothetical protein